MVKRFPTPFLIHWRWRRRRPLILSWFRPGRVTVLMTSLFRGVLLVMNSLMKTLGRLQNPGAVREIGYNAPSIW